MQDVWLQELGGGYTCTCMHMQELGGGYIEICRRQLDAIDDTDATLPEQLLQGSSRLLASLRPLDSAVPQALST